MPRAPLGLMALRLTRRRAQGHDDKRHAAGERREGTGRPGGPHGQARARAAELANDADLRMLPPRDKPCGSAAALTAVGRLAVQQDDRPLMPGTVLTRPYKDRTVRVLVLDNGFEYEGKVYRSLSAIAKAVTGSHWNGHLFFGVAKESHE